MKLNRLLLAIILVVAISSCDTASDQSGDVSDQSGDVSAQSGNVPAPGGDVQAQTGDVQAPGGDAQAPGGDASGNPDFSPVTKAVDTNGDGKMSREEWTSKGLPTSSFEMFENGRDYVTQKDYEENAAPGGIDINGDGKLTVEEFIEFDKAGPPGGGAPGGDAPAGGPPAGDAPAGGPPGGGAPSGS